MLLSRFRFGGKKKAPASDGRAKQKVPELDDYLEKGDYTGAISILEFKLKSLPEGRDLITDLWMGHCLFRAGEYHKAEEFYEMLLRYKDYPQYEIKLFLGCCLFYQGKYTEARDILDQKDKDTKNPLQNRLLFHIAHKLNDEKKLMIHHSALMMDVMEDQLCLASIHYMRQHYTEAIDIYKSLLQKNVNMIALNVYISMCYYKLDYFDVAQEMLNVYLRSFPDSPAALNLKACILFKLYTGKVSMPELHSLPKPQNLYPAARDLVRHNQVVFRNGDGALQVLPSLLEDIPEARLNLILYYLHREDIAAAMGLCENFEPVNPREFLVKAIVYSTFGQKNESVDHLETAEKFYKMVGESASDCDTIPGRQSMASYYFLKKQWDEVIIYLRSIKPYHTNDAAFNFNFGQALLMDGQHMKEADEHLSQVSGDDKDLPVYKYMMARTLIGNEKPQQAFEMAQREKDKQVKFTLMRLIANDSFKYEHYYYSAKAYDHLESIDPSPEYFDGKRAATAGLFKLLVEKKATGEQMGELLSLLDRHNVPQATALCSTIRKWAMRNMIQV